MHFLRYHHHHLEILFFFALHSIIFFLFIFYYYYYSSLLYSFVVCKIFIIKTNKSYCVNNKIIFILIFFNLFLNRIHNYGDDDNNDVCGYVIMAYSVVVFFGYFHLLNRFFLFVIWDLRFFSVFRDPNKQWMNEWMILEWDS